MKELLKNNGKKALKIAVFSVAFCCFFLPDIFAKNAPVFSFLKTHLMNNSEFVSQSVPQVMLPGQKYQVSVVFRNTGRISWAVKNYTLVSQNPAQNNIWSIRRIGFLPSEFIRPGQSKTFIFEVTAPVKSGTYNFQWQMFKRGIGFFGDKSTNLIIKVNSPPVFNPISDQSTFEHKPVQVAILAQDPDADSLVYSVSNLPLGAVFDNSTHNLSWDPQHGQAGAYPNVHFEVSDGINTVSKDIIMSVLKTVVFGTIYEKAGSGPAVPSQGAAVDILDITRTNVIASGVSNASGHFDLFHDAWVDGTYIIRASKPDYRSYSGMATLRNNSMMPFTAILLEGVPPAGTIKINNGSEYTNSTSVNLALSAVDSGSGMGVGAQMKFSNDNILWSTAEPYGANKSWSLTSGNGTKTVYVKFKDAAGNWSEVFSDTIILDTIAPQINIISPLDNELIRSK